MPDILFLPLAPAAPPADALSDDAASIDTFADALDLAFAPTFGVAAKASPSPVPDDPHVALDVAAAVRASHEGRVAALAGAWDDAAAALATSAARRTALVARGAAGPAVAVRGWSDVAVLAAARGDAVGAADALARARALGDALTPAPAVDTALAEVAAWLAGLAGTPEVVDPDLIEMENIAEWPSVDPATPHIGNLTAPDLDAVALDVHAGGTPDWDTTALDVLDVGNVRARAADAPLDVLPMASSLVDAGDAAEAGDHEERSPAPVASGDLTFLELEGPLRVWELPESADASSEIACVVVPPPSAGPLAPPLPSALQTSTPNGARNAAVDAVVALTETAEPRDGRLRSLLRRIARR